MRTNLDAGPAWCMLSADAGGAAADGGLCQAVMAQIRWGRAGLVRAAGHPFAQLVWA